MTYAAFAAALPGREGRLVVIRRAGPIMSLTAAALSVVLVGCTDPSGVDGNLIDDWPLPAEPRIPVPAAAVCYDLDTTDPTTVARWPEPVDCARPHAVETVFVGRFGGSAGLGQAPPSSGSPARVEAYRRCDEAASAFLGAGWRTGLLNLSVVLPSATHWEAGARWYRCDLLEYRDFDAYAVVRRNRTLRGALADPRTVALGCVAIAGEATAIESVLPVPCGDAHNGEFAGIYDHPAGEYPREASARNRANLDGCRDVVAAFAAIPNDDQFRYRVGQVASPFPKAAWELGNRGVRCYLWLPTEVSASFHGAGPDNLPINYA